MPLAGNRNVRVDEVPTLLGRGSRYHDLDPRSEADEVGGIEGQEPGLAMRQHRGDDVGIMHLPATERNGLAEIDERLRDDGDHLPGEQGAQRPSLP